MKDRGINPKKRYWHARQPPAISAQVIIDCSTRQIRKLSRKNG